jgi:hypothetical protein
MAIISFAKTVLDTYNAGMEEFWEATMAPFLSINPIKMLKHRKVGINLVTLFNSMNKESFELLKNRFASDNIDITKWESLQLKREYFQDAWPIYAFLAIWMQEHNVNKPLEQFADILRAVTFGIAGYGILDVQVDGKKYAPIELLIAQTLIVEYEEKILKVFGISETNFQILHRIREYYLNAEIKEKSLRFKKSPYTVGLPEECGSKAAHLLTPFMLSLETIDKTELVDSYFEVFMKFGAVIQIIDDLKDLEEDLAIGHYSYVTLKSDIESLQMKHSAGEIAKLLLNDQQRLIGLHKTCKTLISESNEILHKLNDKLLKRIVVVTDLRLDAFFRKELKVSI